MTKWISTPALPAAIGLSIGILTGRLCVAEMSTFWFATLLALSVLTAVAIYAIFRRPDVCFGLLAFGLGCLLGKGTISPTPPDNFLGSEGILTGTIFKTGETSYTKRIYIRADEWQPDGSDKPLKADFNVLCSVNTHSVNPEIGEKISVKGKLNDVETIADVPYQTDYNKFLFLDGVTERINIYDKENITIVPGSVPKFQNLLNKLNKAWLEAISTCGFNDETTSFMLAVIGGDTSSAPDDIREQFRQTGLTHVLAISGMHVAIIMFVLAALFYPMKLIRGMRPFYFVVLSVLIIFYALITGGSPSASRAAAMCCMLMGCRLLETRSNPLQNLLMAVIVLLCIKPLWLFAPGFQFSVCAVLSIILLMPAVALPQRYPRWLRFLWTLAILPVIVVLGTLVPTLFYFHYFPLNFWLANLVAAMLVPPLIVVGFIVAVASLIGCYSGLLCDIGDSLYSIMTWLINNIARLFPSAQLSFFPSATSLVFLALFIIGLMILVRNYTHKRAAVLGVLGCIILFLIPENTESQPLTEIYIPRNRSYTNLVLVHRGKGYFRTTSSNRNDIAEEFTDATKNYSDFYLLRTGSTEPESLPENLCVDGLCFNGKYLRAGDKTLLIVDEDIYVPDEHIDYAVVTENFRGNIEEIASAIKADTLLLSSSINYFRGMKFERQLQSIGQPFRSLRKGGFSLSIQ